MKTRIPAFAIALLLLTASLGVAQEKAVKPTTPTWTDAKLASAEHPGFKFSGEYVREKLAIQVVPVEDRFYVSQYQGGLPGAGWDGGDITHEWVSSNQIKSHLGGYTKVDRSSKLEFTPPPKNAIVLFDGSNKNEWAFGKINNGLLMAGAKTKRVFTDFSLHFECLIPFKPELPLSHPARGNSGVFALGAYEVQVADTFGLDMNPGAWITEEQIKKPSTWCGSIYGIRAPTTNVCLPPLSWQTFDIDFTAARFSGGEKTTSARMTVKQNGVLIQDNVELPEGTGGGPKGPRDEVPQGPIYIQNHNNPTQYRNIWVIDRTK